MNTRVKIVGIAVLCFTAGFVTHRIVTFQEVKKLENQVYAALDRLWGFEHGEGRELFGTLSQHVTWEEMADLMAEVHQMGSRQKIAQSDALAAAYALSFYVNLKSGHASVAEQRAASVVAWFYRSYKDVSFTDGELGQNMSAIIDRIRRAMEEHPELSHVIMNTEPEN